MSMKNSVGSALIFVSGGIFGFLVAQKYLDLKYKKIADDEIASVKEHYAILRKEGTYSDPVKLAEDKVDKEKLEQLRAKYAPTDDVVVTNNIFEQAREEGHDPGELENPELEDGEPADISYVHDFESTDIDTYWDWAEENARRESEPDKPYVITLAEYMAGERGYTQTNLTYYDGDDVLADERDSIIEDIEGTIGYINLLRFGHASDDKNIVYIRNNKIELDFEVVKSDGKFAEEVLGYIEHTDKPVLRRFRDYD